MKKRTKILISMLVVVVFFIIFDIASYEIANRKFLNDYVPKDQWSSYHFPAWWENKFRFHDVTTMKWFEENGGDKLFRPAAGLEYKKSPIWIFGCSFVYGTSMVNGHHPDEETFGYILSKTTHRPVYTRGYPSWGIQHMYYQLEKGDIFKTLPNPDYVVYVFISDHARRMQKLIYDFWSDGAYLRYEEKNGKLVQIKPILEPLWKLNAVKVYLTNLEYKVRAAYDKHEENFDLLEKYLFSSQEILKQHNPNVKFIVLKYNGGDGFDQWFLDTERWKEIKDKGIIVIDADKELGVDLKDKKYLDPDNYHPNSYAWEKISEMLPKKYIK